MLIYNTLNDIVYNATSVLNKGIYFIKNKNEDKFVSYADIYKKSLQVLYNLQLKGFNVGDQLLFQIKDKYIEEYVYIFWACILGGIIAVPLPVEINDNVIKVFNVWKKLINPRMVTDKDILNNLRKVASEENLVTNYEGICKHVILIDEIMKESGIGKIYHNMPENIALIQFSSGSTGNAKGVVLTHENLIINIEDIVKKISITKQDSVLNWMPLTHDMAMLMCHLTPFAQHINLYLMPPSLFIGEPLLWFEKLNQYKITISATPNFGLQLLLNNIKNKIFNWKLDSVRLLFNGGEPISADLANDFFQQMKVYGLKKNTMCPVYGLSEASVVSMPKDGNWKYTCVKRESIYINKRIIEINENESNTEGIKFVSVGTSLDRCIVRIFDGNNPIYEDCVVGHVQVNCKNIMKGYYRDQEATAKVINSEGWMDTGDLGFLKNGELYITGRFKDIIFVNGVNYFPNDIENICENVDGVSKGSVAVVGTYDVVKQKEILLVFVAFTKEIKEFVELCTNIKMIIHNKISIDVNSVIPIDVIPKTSSGKIQRYKLVNMYEKGMFNLLINQIDELEKEKANSRCIKSPNNKIQQDLIDICREVLELDELSINDRLIDFSGSSLIMINIYTKINSKYPGRIQIGDLYSSYTISELSALISKFDDKHKVLNYILGEDITQSLKKVAINENISIYNILLGLLAYEISDSTGKQLILMDWMENKSYVIHNISIDFSSIEYFRQLFKELHEDINESINEKFKESVIDRKIKAEQDFNILFICENNIPYEDKRLLDKYDLVVKVNKEKNKIKCNFTCNYKYIKQKYLMELIHKYKNIIEAFIENY